MASSAGAPSVARIARVYAVADARSTHTAIRPWTLPSIGKKSVQPVDGDRSEGAALASPPSRDPQATVSSSARALAIASSEVFNDITLSPETGTRVGPRGLQLPQPRGRA